MHSSPKVTTLKIVVMQIIAILGLCTSFTMISQLERRCTTAENARDAYQSVITQYLESLSGADDAPSPPLISIDDRVNLKQMAIYSSQSRLTPALAKWLAIGGFLLFTYSLLWRCRLEKK